MEYNLLLLSQNIVLILFQAYAYLMIDLINNLINFRFYSEETDFHKDYGHGIKTRFPYGCKI